MATRILALLGAALALSACGGGGTEPPAQIQQATAAPAPAPTPAVPQPTDLLVIGNSLAHHPPAPQIGWTGNWGMAASSEAADYAHQAAALLGVPVTVRHSGDLEHGDTSLIAGFGALVGPGTIVVLQVGDNARGDEMAAFKAGLAQLLKAAGGARKIVCLGLWWAEEAKEEQLRPICEAAGGTPVHIGDIAAMPGNRDAEQPFAHGGVNAHPHDWSMAEIGRRIAAAAR